MHRTQRDATFMIAYVTGLGVVLYGDQAYGMASLDRLRSQAETDSFAMVEGEYIFSRCASCRGAGELTEECTTCRGSGRCSRCDGRGARLPAERQSPPSLERGRSVQRLFMSSVDRRERIPSVVEADEWTGNPVLQKETEIGMETRRAI